MVNTQRDDNSIISNKIETIKEKIAKNQVKINEHIELEKKTELSVEELWKLVEGTDTENKWYQVGKKGKVIDLQEQSHDLRSEHLKQNQTSKKLELVIFGDSITKYIIPENICKCDPQQAVNLSKSGAKVKKIYKQLSIF